MWSDRWRDRGVPSDHDAGPSLAWAELFAATPNHRRMGVERLHDDRVFRWEFGPMHYRGRLDGTAKVLVIGQEGAQDESLSHRSFTGGSGARMQHLLRHLGITRSYLFFNTFVYPIHGEYEERLRPLAQGDSSPIVAHRHRLLEQAAHTSDLRLVISVGVAARETVATWRRMRGGELPPGVQYVHVVHPGAATAGGGADVRRSFAEAVATVAALIHDDAGWLPTDPGVERDLAGEYRLGSAPVPFADLPFGICWRLGRGSTSSNRRDGGRSIQLFSARGKYDARDVQYPGSAAGSREGYAQDDGDLAYEPPKAKPMAFDRGPGAAWAKLLMGGEPGADWPDFERLGLPCDDSMGFGPVLRGRPGDAVAVVLADPAGHDDVFTGRALSGDLGQRLQRFLGLAGFTTSYAILRVCPVAVAGAPPAALDRLVEDAGLRGLLRTALARMSRSQVLLTLGPLAARLASHVNARDLPVVALGPAAETWQATREGLDAMALDRDRAPGPAYDGARGQIAREDLAYGTVRWWATSGDRALQGRVDDRPSADYVKLVMPAWAAKLDP